MKGYAIAILLVMVASSCMAQGASVTRGEVEAVLPAMARIEGGSFMMGTAKPIHQVEEDSTPAHRVTLSTFWMAETLVTQKLWNLFIKDTGYKGYTFGHSYYGSLAKNSQGEDSPAIFLTWSEAVVFCNWFSVKMGLEPAYTIVGTLNPVQRGGIRATWKRGTTGFRLITEAEWEYVMFEKGAPREQLMEIYGTEFARKQESLVPSVTKGQTTSFGVLAYPNFGVREWTWDEYLMYGIDPLTDPTGKSGLSSDGNSKVNRFFVDETIYYRLASDKEDSEGEFIVIRLAQDRR